MTLLVWMTLVSHTQWEALHRYFILFICAVNVYGGAANTNNETIPFISYEERYSLLVKNRTNPQHIIR